MSKSNLTYPCKSEFSFFYPKISEGILISFYSWPEKVWSNLGSVVYYLPLSLQVCVSTIFLTSDKVCYVIYIIGFLHKGLAFALMIRYNLVNVLSMKRQDRPLLKAHVATHLVTNVRLNLCVGVHVLFQVLFMSKLPLAHFTFEFFLM